MGVHLYVQEASLEGNMEWYDQTIDNILCAFYKKYLIVFIFTYMNNIQTAMKPEVNTRLILYRYLSNYNTSSEYPTYILNISKFVNRFNDRLDVLKTGPFLL